ncbi:MAG TPA: radical SAM family heme chaperone HemW [Acidimicrobiales bacterium]
MSEFGVYVHVPFCVRRCDYCAFATWTDRFHLATEYVDACATQLRWLRSVGEVPVATSVFFGGGTPSLLEPSALGSVLAEVALAPGAEVTVECNPETVDEPKLRGYRSVGVNRISFGAQSMVPHVLGSLGRVHSVDSVLRALDAAASAGFGSNYNVDLIFGAAGESVGDWESTLKAILVVDPAPSHVSAYALTVEPGTPLALDRRRHPDSDDQADKYLLADSMLHDAGYSWYEISNWAKPGAECRHNQLYWAQGEYVGIGCAAHSHRVYPMSGTARRWWNVRTPDRYVSMVRAGEQVEAAGETLDAERRRSEALELALRTRSGVPEGALPGWREDPDLAGLVEPAEVGTVGAGRLRLTLRGRLLANEVSLRLMP